MSSFQDEDTRLVGEINSPGQLWNISAIRHSIFQLYRMHESSLLRLLFDFNLGVFDPDHGVLLVV